MHLEASDFPGRDGGKRAVLRGEHVISRKAIAQGMSDVLRCPVCSCAAFFALFAHETAGAARIRHSLRPLNWRGRKLNAKLGRNAPRDRETISTSSRRTPGPITPGRSFAKALCHQVFTERSRGMRPGVR